MSNYTDTSHVQAEFKSLDISVNTSVTPTTVQYFLDEADAIINSKLGLKYSTPLTSSVGLLLARNMATLLVADRIRKIIEVAGQSPGKNQAGVKDERKTAMDMMDDIVAGKIYLPGETLATSGDGVRGYTDDNGVTTQFDVEVENW